MAKVYYDLIHMGLRKLEDVPAPWEKQVEDLLAQDEVDNE